MNFPQLTAKMLMTIVIILSGLGCSNDKPTAKEVYVCINKERQLVAVMDPLGKFTNPGMAHVGWLRQEWKEVCTKWEKHVE